MLTSYSKSEKAKSSPFYKTRAATAATASNKETNVFFVTATGNTGQPNNSVAAYPSTSVASLPSEGNVKLNSLSDTCVFIPEHKLEGKVADTQEYSGDELDEYFDYPEKDTSTLVRPNFLNEPYKANKLMLSDESITKLNGDTWLSTELLDFLIKNSTPYWLPTEVSIPSSNVEFLLDELNAKAVSNDPEDLEFVKNKRNEYKYFAKKPIRIYTFSKQKGHYFLLEMIVDGTDKEGDFFQYISIYDNLLRRERNNNKNNQKKKKLKNYLALDLLKKYQTFFYNYVFYDKAETLLNSKYKDSIFDEVTYVESPILENTYDCGLYAFSILLHLLRGIQIKQDVFTQSHITAFRNGLRIVVNGPIDELQSDPKKYIPVEFIYSFFGLTYQKTIKRNPFTIYLHKITNRISPIKSPITNKIGKLDEEHQDHSSELNDNEEHVEDTSTSSEDNVVDTSSPSDKIIEEEEDYLFTDMFVHGNDPEGNMCNYDDIKDLDDLSKKIREYEVATDIKLRIQKSNSKVGSRLYTCVSHKNCVFRARFGPKRGNKKLILKNKKLCHSGIDREGRYDNGKRFKNQLSATIGVPIEAIEDVKHGKPVARDVVKASRNLTGNNPSYNQGHQYVAKKICLDKFESKKSYELIIPYIEEFKKKNPGTVANYELDNNSSIKKLFLCPGIMNNKLRFARPVMALDATHLGLENKGTLFLACVKSGNDELLPIAIGITEDNENYEGWNYFLYYLNEACGHLTDDHYLSQCRNFKLWSFVSDRDKGLLPALRDRFPGNHQTNCLFHIRQNVCKEGGVKAGDLAFAIGGFGMKRCLHGMVW